MKVMDFEWQGRKVLVTGASGFKASWLCAGLLALGARVHGTVRKERQRALSAYSVLDLERRIAPAEVDVRDAGAVRALLASVAPEVVFHLAAKAVVPASLQDPRGTFEVNLMGTLNLIEACRGLEACERLLICSTDHVFGSTEAADLPVQGHDETTRVSYSGPYDTSKAAMELLARSYHYTYWPELPAMGMTRAANAFGFGDVNQRRVMPGFVRAAVRDKVIAVRTPASGRQFVHVTDAIAGYIRAASSLREGGAAAKRGKQRPPPAAGLFTPTFQFAIEQYPGTPTPYITMKGLAHLVGSLLAARVELPQSVDAVWNENKTQAMNCRLTRETLGWRVLKPLDKAIADLALWYEAEASPSRLAELAERDVEALVAAATG